MEQPTKPSKTGDTVVIAVDGSEYSDYAFKFYAEDLHKPGNNVLLVHSSEYKCTSFPAVSIMSGDVAVIQNEIQSEEKKTDELVEKLNEELEKLKMDGTIERIHGEAGHAIIHLAEEKGADYIVVGCRGKSQVRRTFTGSVTDYIVHHSNIPVMVARHKDHIHHHHHHHFHLNPFHHHHHHHKHGEHGHHDKKHKEAGEATEK